MPAKKKMKNKVINKIIIEGMRVLSCLMWKFRLLHCTFCFKLPECLHGTFSLFKDQTLQFFLCAS